MYQVPSTETLKALHPGSKVLDAQGRTHTLNNVTTDTEVGSGAVLSAAGYSREADGWLNLLTGLVKSGPWLAAQEAQEALRADRAELATIITEYAEKPKEVQ